MKLILSILTMTLLFSPTPESPALRMTRIIVEGVADSPGATRLAALASIKERVEGVDFTILAGKYPAYSLGISSTTMDTRGKRFLDTVRLPSGFYKSRMEVNIPQIDLVPQEGLREVYGRGCGEIMVGTSLNQARIKALDTAMGDAIINSVKALYPTSSVPFRLTGTIYLLGTTKEVIEENNYVIELRALVELKPI